MTTTLATGPRTGKPAKKPGLLHGVTWLVVRQHRTALWLIAAVTLLGAATIVHQRGEMASTLDRLGWPGKDVHLPSSPEGFQFVSQALGALPVILGVFLGAPLIAGDQEHGTAHLVTTQSVPRRRWLAAKLIGCLSAVLVSTAVLGALFTWWWEPYREVLPADWMQGEVFDATGPMPAAHSLFLTACGIAIGMLLRRALPAMTVTFFFSVAVELAWGEFRDRLATPRLFTYPLNADDPAFLDQAVETDRWIGTADGQLFGWGTCAEQTERATDACVKEHGIVNNVVEYFGYDQMPGMQWTGAGLLLGGTAVVAVFILWRATRRPL
ncbi:ABC transporter permease [Streptomyces sp. G44]|uniref:ABC transporter permease n=1 Tax=Streptomyces sp. G44 TaxID=2807632 RepID=UPI00195F2867|nr:ABC transporter permease subunit [Streptomyces sp. G44]MBM7167672.1 ABC transporter permease [Streptomyces sp. G44]